MAGVEPSGGSEAHLYMVPFDRVWRAASALLGPERGWTVLSADPHAGSIIAERSSAILRRRLRLRLTISLDELGATRVEAVFLRRNSDQVASRGRFLAARILRRLDRALAADASA